MIQSHENNLFQPRPQQVVAPVPLAKAELSTLLRKLAAARLKIQSRYESGNQEIRKMKTTGFTIKWIRVLVIVGPILS